MKKMMILAATLGACAPRSVPEMNALDARIDNVEASVADLRNAGGDPAYSPGELGRIERECAAASIRDSKSPSCDWSNLVEARGWEEDYRTHRALRRGR